MKKYLAFYGYVYYPNRGMEDFIGDYDTLEKAIIAIEEAYKNDENSEWSETWGNIWNTDERIEVYKKTFNS